MIKLPLPSAALPKIKTKYKGIQPVMFEKDTTIQECKGCIQNILRLPGIQNG